MTRGRKSIGLYLVPPFLILYCCLTYAAPAISYKGDSVTTPRKYIDKFKLQKESQTISPNETKNSNWSSDPIPQRKQKAQFEMGRSEMLNKVKSVFPGEKTMRRMNDEDDDDDDDGGEYGGLQSGACEKKKDRSKDAGQGISMMAVRQMDVVAVEFPLAAPQAHKEWSKWSPCSRSCGDGVQSRWRSKTSGPDKEQQFRTCHQVDCNNS